MIDTVLFDMGGTLEDIWVDDESRHSSIQGVLDILRAHGIDLNMDFETTAQSINAGWERYGAYRDPRQRELKPEEIWGSFVLTDFGLNEDSVRPYAEELAHMWEITHYHRTLRPHVKEMLEGLKGLGMKLGVISNTASLYQVFDVLKDYGIRDYFQDVTLSSVTGYRKPDPNIFWSPSIRSSLTPPAVPMWAIPSPGTSSAPSAWASAPPSTSTPTSPS